MPAMTWDEAMLEVPGGRVWSRTYGGGTATPVLVLHGGPGMPSFYLEALAALADERAVILYDQLGCGRSERPVDPALWTLDRAVAEVEAVRSGLALDRVHVLGHSWGGFLALAHAAAHPDVVESLVLSSPLVSVAGWIEDAAALVSLLPPELRLVIAANEERGTFDDPAYLAATEEFNHRFFCTLDPWPAELQRTFEGLGEGPYATMWGPSEFTQTGNLVGADLTATLEGLRAPSLWICGDRDEISPNRLKSFAALASGWSEVIEGGSHCVHLEQPERYLGVIRDFLGSVDVR